MKDLVCVNDFNVMFDFLFVFFRLGLLLQLVTTDTIKKDLEEKKVSMLSFLPLFTSCFMKRLQIIQVKCSDNFIA